MMEDDILKSIFSNYEPKLTSDYKFLSNLSRDLNSVDLVKQHASEVKSRNKKAVALAAFIGFIVGFLFSLSLPHLSDAVSNWQLSLPDESVLNIIADNYAIIAWIVIGGTSVLAALNTYEISLSLLNNKVTSK